MRGSRFLARVGLLSLASGFVLTAVLSGCDKDTRPIIKICDPLDMVVIIDTSGSMDDEAAALCASVTNIGNELTAAGIDVNMTILGVTEDTGNDPAAYACLGGDVGSVLGTAVPGGGTLDQPEDWGPAVAIVAARFPWLPGRLRVIVPMSDEAPQDGAPCEDPGADRDALDNAVAVANANNVAVSPITGTGASACVRNLAIDLAADTGGEHRRSVAPDVDLADTMIAAGRATCFEAPFPPL